MRIKKKSLGIASFFIALLLFSAYSIATPFSESNSRILAKKDNLLSNSELSSIVQGGLPQTLTGFTETTFKEDFETGEFVLEHKLYTEENTYTVHFETSEPFPESGSEVTVEGFASESDLVVTSLEVSQSNSLRGPSRVSKIGEQRLLVVLVNFQSDPRTPITPEEARERVFNENNPNSLTSWFRTVSYNQTWLTGDVVDWVTVPYTASQMCDIAALKNAVFPVIDPYTNFMNYDRVMFVFPLDYSCGYQGIGTYGQGIALTGDGQSYLSFTLLNGEENLDDGTGAHELGHNFGLLHAADLECANNAIAESGCTGITYGDEFDLMGRTVYLGHFSAHHLMVAEWLTLNNFHTVVEGTSGDYTIEPLETSPQGMKAVRIQRGSGNEWIYVEYRRPIGFDHLASDLNGPEVYNGALIRIKQFSTLASTADTFLIDNSPHATSSQVSQINDSTFTALGVGQTFTDSKTGITVTLISQTENSLTLHVNSPVLCGNGVLNTGEQCDGNVFAAGSCTNLSTFGPNGPVFYDGGTLACSQTCRYISTQCTIRESCPWDQNGDGIVTAGDRGFVSTQIGCAVGTGNPLCDLADLSGEGHVNAADRGFISANIGVCPA